MATSERSPAERVVDVLDQEPIDDEEADEAVRELGIDVPAFAGRLREAVDRTRERPAADFPLRAVIQIGGTLEGGGDGPGEGLPLSVDITVTSPRGEARGRLVVIATDEQLSDARLAPEAVMEHACGLGLDLVRDVGEGPRDLSSPVADEPLELSAARAFARAAEGRYEQLLDALGLITVNDAGERVLPTAEAAIARAHELVASYAEAQAVAERIQRMIDETQIGAPSR